MAFLVPIFVRHSSFTPRLVQKPLLQRRWSERRARTIVAQAGTPIRNNPKLGFIGMGVMGLPMLSNLSKSFPDLVVWNRSDKREEVDSAIATSAKLRIAKTPAEVVSEADITFSMLSTPEAVRSVFYDHDSSALSSISPGKSLIDCSTLQISDMVETARIVSERGGSFLEAPVSGSKVPAEQGQLIFLCGGDKNLFDDPVSQTAFDLMGKKAFYLGDVGNGTKMKLVVNQLMATMLAALSESIVLTESIDLSVSDLLEVLSLGAMNNPMFALKGPKMKHGAKGYATNFPLEHALKDSRFGQALGDDQGISMAVNAAANEWYKSAKGLGYSRDDFCAVIESIRAASGRN